MFSFHQACTRVVPSSVRRTFWQSIQNRLYGAEAAVTSNGATIIDGKEISKVIKKEVKQEINEWVQAGNRQPHLSVVLVGDDPASATYVKNKMLACKRVGITSTVITKESDITQAQLLEVLDSLNENEEVDGLLVQLPVPDHIDERTVCNYISPMKDVDGFHISNVGRMCLDQTSMLPATPSGVWELLKRYNIETHGKTALVCGRSKNVGMPMAMLLHTDHRHERPGGDSTVIQTHRYTPREELKRLAKVSDIVVAAAGIPGLITADMVKPGSCIIDVGINRVPNGKGGFKLVGDVDFDEVRKVAGHITPVPGGVGPMTVAMLMKNTIVAAKKAIKY